MKRMISYLSVCSGIGTEHVAWHSLGYACVGFAETEDFASAVLAHRFPEIPNYGDFTKIQSADVGPVDVLVGGTPCQSFSLAGLRGGLDDNRGNLTLQFAELARRLRVKWIVWENVVGVLTSNQGRDFAAILTAFRECGYCVAYRILDAKHFGVPQQRRRVFVIGYLGDDWRPPSQVLFASESVCGNFAESLLEEEATARASAYRTDSSRLTFVPTLLRETSGTVMTTFGPKNATNHQEALNGALIVGINPLVNHDVVRRITPRECERLQGLPDDWTLVPYMGKLAPDTRRYKVIGNGMAMPVMRWIGHRLRFFNNQLQ